MNNKIETELKKIGRLIERAKDIHVTDDDLLAYAEDRLASAARQAVDKYLLSYPELASEILLLKKLVAAEPAREVPPALHRKVISALGIDEEYMMQLILKRVKSAFEIIMGDSFYKPGLGLSLVPTRGTAAVPGSLYVFQTVLASYRISCRLQAGGGKQFLHFTLEAENGEGVKNGRFIVTEADRQIYELLTDSTGTTPAKMLPAGDYEIVFSMMRKNLGTLKLTIS